MATLRKSARGARQGSHPGQPGVLLDSESPYASRRVVVEFDGATTAAYLHDAGVIVGAAWIANHQPAPASIDLSRVDAGKAPLMPADHTKQPTGRPPLDKQALRALWFEEGDGVAIIEDGQLLAVIPGWSDMSRGMPGYSRDAMGQTPFAWSLDDAMEGLGPRADRATAFWRWRQREDSWAGFQQSMLGHLLARLGPGARYWDVGGGKQPIVGVSERAPTEQRPYTVLSTIGMSCQRMPVVEQVMEDPSGTARIELAIATTMPSPEVARIFLWLAPVPVAGGHLVRCRAQYPLVPRARDVPAGRRQRGRAAAGQPRPAARARGTRPVGVLVQRRAGAVAVDSADQRAGAAAGQGARRHQPGEPAGRAAAVLAGRRLGAGLRRTAGPSGGARARRRLGAGQCRLMIPRRLTIPAAE